MLSLLGRRVLGVARLSQRHAPSSGRRVAPLASSAAAASPDGSMDSSALLEGMKAKITTQLEAQSVDIQDAYGDAQHVTIDVVSAAFEGKNKVQRQRMVYKAIWEEMQSAVHAVDAMTTKTPDEA
jgi:stress-induced morphogen